jgi:hypothetical protein
MPVSQYPADTTKWKWSKPRFTPYKVANPKLVGFAWNKYRDVKIGALVQINGNALNINWKRIK